jgi:tellurite resistance protein TehA-like permease
MAPDQDSMSTTEIEERLQQLGHYSKYVKAGFGIILGAFVLAAVGLLPSNLGSVASAVEAILLPLIFVGMGLLLFGIGMHLHLMHLNLVRQLRMDSNSDSDSSEDEKNA